MNENQDSVVCSLQIVAGDGTTRRQVGLRTTP